MLNLLKNEYQKIFAKIGTYIMLLLILAACIGFQFILKSAKNVGQMWEPTKDSVQSSYEYYVSLAESDPDYRQMRDLYKAMLDLEIYDADYYGDDQSWQGTALNSVYSSLYYIINDDAGVSEEKKQIAKKAFDEIISSIKQNNFESYCKTIISTDGIYAFESIRCQLALDMKITPDHWAYSLLDELSSSKLTLDRYKNLKEEDYDDSYYNAKKSFELANYRIANDIEFCVTDNTSQNSFDMFTGQNSKYDFHSDFWLFIYNSSGLITAVTIMVVIIAGGIIASEYSQGTIKFLLINPVTRRKIFLSKYLTTLSMAAILSVLVFGVIYITDLLLGLNGSAAKYLVYADGAITAKNTLSIVCIPYFMNLIEALMIITLAFTISSLMRSSAIAIGVSAGVLLAGSSVTSILSMLNIDFARYFFFANTNLFSIMNGNSIFPHHSLGFAVTNLVLHWIVLFLIAYDAFTRKEI